MGKIYISFKRLLPKKKYFFKSEIPKNIIILWQKRHTIKDSIHRLKKFIVNYVSSKNLNPTKSNQTQLRLSFLLNFNHSTSNQLTYLSPALHFLSLPFLRFLALSLSCTRTQHPALPFLFLLILYAVNFSISPVSFILFFRLTHFLPPTYFFPVLPQLSLLTLNFVLRCLF